MAALPLVAAAAALLTGAWAAAGKGEAEAFPAAATAAATVAHALDCLPPTPLAKLPSSAKTPVPSTPPGDEAAGTGTAAPHGCWQAADAMSTAEQRRLRALTALALLRGGWRVEGEAGEEGGGGSTAGSGVGASMATVVSTRVDGYVTGCDAPIVAARYRWSLDIHRAAFEAAGRAGGDAVLLYCDDAALGLRVSLTALASAAVPGAPAAAYRLRVAVPGGAATVASPAGLASTITPLPGMGVAPAPLDGARMTPAVRLARVARLAAVVGAEEGSSVREVADAAARAAPRVASAPLVVEVELDGPSAGSSSGGTRVAVTVDVVGNVLADGAMLAVALPLPSSAAADTAASLHWNLPGCPLRRIVVPTHDMLLVSSPGGAGEAGAAVAPAASSGTLLAVLEPASVTRSWPATLPPSPITPGGTWVPLPTGLAPHGVVTASPPPLPPPTAAAAPPPTPATAATGDGALVVPRHIAVVMDGNGRWARSRGLPRTEGHTAGVEAIHRIIRGCRRVGVQFLTLYAFSSQNWSRPEAEVRALMRLLMDFVATDCEELVANGVRLLVIGDMAKLPALAQGGLQRLIDASARNRGLTLCLALSYGGREEIATAAACAARAAKAGHLDPDRLTPESFRAFMPHPDVPDPDLLIRTSGEVRLSNFLLWQIAYTELHVTPILWPDFGDDDLTAALVAYAGRERRFGKTGEQVAAERPVPAPAPPQVDPLHAHLLRPPVTSSDSGSADERPSARRARARREARGAAAHALSSAYLSAAATAATYAPWLPACCLTRRVAPPRPAANDTAGDAVAVTASPTRTRKPHHRGATAPTVHPLLACAPLFAAVLAALAAVALLTVGSVYHFGGVGLVIGNGVLAIGVLPGGTLSFAGTTTALGGGAPPAAPQLPALPSYAPPLLASPAVPTSSTPTCCRAVAADSSGGNSNGASRLPASDSHLPARQATLAHTHLPSHRAVNTPAASLLAPKAAPDDDVASLPWHGGFEDEVGGSCGEEEVDDAEEVCDAEYDPAPVAAVWPTASVWPTVEVGPHPAACHPCRPGMLF